MHREAFAMQDPIMSFRLSPHAAKSWINPGMATAPSSPANPSTNLDSTQVDYPMIYEIIPEDQMLRRKSVRLVVVNLDMLVAYETRTLTPYDIGLSSI